MVPRIFPGFPLSSRVCSFFASYPRTSSVRIVQEHRPSRYSLELNLCSGRYIAVLDHDQGILAIDRRRYRKFACAIRNRTRAPSCFNLPWLADRDRIYRAGSRYSWIYVTRHMQMRFDLHGQSSRSNFVYSINHGMFRSRERVTSARFVLSRDTQSPQCTYDFLRHTI